jgi:hypothetical protein
METIRGKTSRDLDISGLKERLVNFNQIHLDLGTGDGRYPRALAAGHPDWFVIGIDSCRENLREHSQAKLKNLLFVIASAQHLPPELHGCVSHVSINFPWGSLLGSLLAGDAMLMGGLECVARADVSVELRLNGGALAEAGTSLEAGTDAIYHHLHRAGWRVSYPVRLDARGLREFPSTWAKRLAFGRDPRAMMLHAHK